MFEARDKSRCRSARWERQCQAGRAAGVSLRVTKEIASASDRERQTDVIKRHADNRGRATDPSLSDPQADACGSPRARFKLQRSRQRVNRTAGAGCESTRLAAPLTGIYRPTLNRPNRIPDTAQPQNCECRGDSHRDGGRIPDTIATMVIDLRNTHCRTHRSTSFVWSHSLP